MSHEANFRQVSCDGKDPLTPSRARQISDDMRKRGRKKVQAYHCPYCKSWHVGSRSTKRIP